MDLTAGDDRREQAVAIKQAEAEGRAIIGEVFAGSPLDDAKARLLLDARTTVIDQWGKASAAALRIGQVLLDLSEKLSEDEFRAVRRGSDRLFPFSDSVATKLRLAAYQAQQWRIPADQSPPYTLMYEISTLPPEGQDLALQRGLVRPDVKRAEIVAIRQELRRHKVSGPVPTIIEAEFEEQVPSVVTRDDLERRQQSLAAEQDGLRQRLAEIETEMTDVARQLRALDGGEGDAPVQRSRRARK